ncbi:peptidase C45 [Chloroflexia bacterium SDU3-3]|nr:peptidase C45 [Chloroflexia bacterium SDU3-3]
MFPIIEVSGGPRERGRQYGQQAAALVRRSVASYARLFAFTRGVDWRQAHGEALRYLPVIERHAPDIAEEMRGIAEGAGLPFESVLALNCRTELIAGVRAERPHALFEQAVAANRALGAQPVGECTAAAALPEATAGGAALLAQTWDWYGEQRAACVVLRIAAPGEPVVATVTEAGIVAKLGMNSAGLAVSLNILYTDQDGLEPGVPVHIQLRRMLQRRSVAEAAALPREACAGASSCITAVDAAGGGVCMEISPGGVSAVAPSAGLLAHSNHCLCPPALGSERPIAEGASTVPRYERAMALLHAAHGQIGVAHMQAILRDHDADPLCICRHPDPASPLAYQPESVLGAVMDVSSGELHLAPDIPCLVPFERLRLL